MKKYKENELMILVQDNKLSIKLCDWNSGYSSAYCNNSNSCPGSNNDNCNPNYVWSGGSPSSSVYSYNLNKGSWSGNTDTPTYAQSVRCVTDFLEKVNSKKIKEKNNIYFPKTV